MGDGEDLRDQEEFQEGGGLPLPSPITGSNTLIAAFTARLAHKVRVGALTLA